MKVLNTTSSSNGGNSLPHVETNATDIGGQTNPIVIPNLTASQKPQTDGFVANTTGFTNKWTGWAGQNGAPQGR